MFLVDGVYDGDYLSHHAQHGYGSMIDTAKESVQCSEDTTGDVVKTNAWAYVMHSEIGRASCRERVSFVV